MWRAAILLISFLFQAQIITVRAQEDATNEFNIPPIQLLTADQLDELLGPIALYPDPLLAAVLTAATQPAEVVMAARFVERLGDAEQVDNLEWSESLKALARYPDVLLWMEENLEWTSAVGKAFLLQPEDVMDAIQRLRARAEQLGNLVSTELQRVESDDGNIDILPVDPDFVYLPQYEPDIVFKQPAAATIGPLVTFGGGKRAGVWLRHDWDWTNRRIVVWQHEQPRSRAWWGQTRTVRFQNAKHFGEWCPQPRKGQAQGKWWGQRRALSQNPQAHRASTPLPQGHSRAGSAPAASSAAAPAAKH
jgi:hypothetical protein